MRGARIGRVLMVLVVLLVIASFLLSSLPGYGLN
jgi:hypothetical protein